jgi:hypothetical protein
MRPLGVISLLLFLACNGSPTDPAGSTGPRGTTIVLQNGSSTQVSNDLRVSFVRIDGDSRCPASVMCPWSGNAAVRLDVTTGDSVQSTTLNTAGGTAFPRESSAAGYTFTLIKLDPARHTNDPVPAAEYRATIQVTR